MAIQDFTAGQILTAAQMDTLQANDYNQTVSTKTDNYVLVAADKGTRLVMNAATAKTFTVDSGLFAAGDTLILQNIGAGTATVLAGTCTVTTAGSLVMAQYGGGELYFTSASAAIFFPSGGKSVVTNISTFTSSGTFTVPTGVTYAIAHIRGGGGGVGLNSSPGTGGTSSVAFVAGTQSAIGGVPFVGSYTGSVGTLKAAIAGTANSGNGASLYISSLDNGGASTVVAYGTAEGQAGAEIVFGAAVTPGGSITVTVGAGGVAGSNTGAAGGSGLVWIEYGV
jgi:hypothetical protein